VVRLEEDELAEDSVCGFGFGGRGAEDDQRSAKESDIDRVHEVVYLPKFVKQEL